MGGASGTFVSRDPNNNCEFKYDECPAPEVLIFCTSDTSECPGAPGQFVSRDPNNNCEFKYDECPVPWSHDDLYFPIYGYDGCHQCLRQGGAVHRERINRPRTDQMKANGITHDRYEYHPGDFCMPKSDCEELNDTLVDSESKVCFTVKDKNRETFPSQICQES